MMKLFGFFLVLLAIVGFGVIVLWMNLTPGYFQKAIDVNKIGCNQCVPEKVAYVTDEESGRLKTNYRFGFLCPAVVQDCRKKQWSYMHITLLNSAKLMLARLDFNK